MRPSHQRIMEARRVICAAVDGKLRPFTVEELCDECNLIPEVVNFFLERLEMHGYLVGLSTEVFAQTPSWISYPPNIFSAGSVKHTWSAVWGMAPHNYIASGY